MGEFFRKVSLKVCEKVAEWAQAGADKFRRPDERDAEATTELPSAEALLRLGDAAFTYSSPRRGPGGGVLPASSGPAGREVWAQGDAGAGKPCIDLGRTRPLDHHQAQAEGDHRRGRRAGRTPAARQQRTAAGSQGKPEVGATRAGACGIGIRSRHPRQRAAARRPDAAVPASGLVGSHVEASRIRRAGSAADY